MKTYLCVYLGSLILAVIITPIVIHIAHLLKIYDSPDVRKVHALAIPRVGGMAIFSSAITLVIATLFLDNKIGEAFRSIRPQIITFLVASIFIFTVGLIDDLYKIRARHKLLAQIIAAIILCLGGIRINALNFANLFTLNFGWFAIPITVFWIIAITNAVNLVDGLDGLAAGISAVTCAAIAILAFDRGLVMLVVIMLALLGSLSGFLFFNFNPARIFMGDCGSMFLGFVLASTSIMCAAKCGTVVALALPALALGLPIFDTIFTMLRRYLGRRGIMSPDRNHLHHRLLDMGLQHRHVVIIMYAITVLAAGTGMLMMLTQGIGAVAIFFCVLLLLVLAFRSVGAIRLREVIAGLKKKHIVSYQVKHEIEDFENIELYFHQAKLFEQWWQAVCFAADKMDFTKGSLPLTNRDGTKRTLDWEKKLQDAPLDEFVKMTLPVRDRRAGPSLQLDVEVHTNGSIESVGRRIALFGRLIEEYSIINLPNEKNISIFNADENKKQLIESGNPSQNS